MGTDYGSSTDWYNEIEQIALSNVHNLSVEGGTTQTSWRFSLNYRNVNGILRHSGFEQLNGRINLAQTAFKDKLKLYMGIAGTDKEINYSFDEAFHYAPIYNPTAPVSSDDAEYNQYGGYFQKVFFDYYNPVSLIDLNKNEGKQRFLEINVKASLKLAKWLSLDTHFADQTDKLSSSKYFSKNDLFGGTNYKGVATRKQDDTYSKLFEATLHFSGTPIADVIADIYGGYSYQDFMNEGLYTSVNGFLTDQFTYNNLEAAGSIKGGNSDVQSGKSTHRLAGFFGIIHLGWKNWLLNASYRYEGSSRLGINKKWAPFPSIGIAYKWKKFLKLRMSYGVTGNIPSSSYQSLSRLITYGNRYPYGSKWIPMYQQNYFANPDLKAERKREFDMGIDFSLFESKLQGTFDYYKSTAFNLLMEYYVSSDKMYYGYWNYLWLNSGEIQNSGKELTLNYNLIQTQDLSYRLYFAAAWGLKNKIISTTGIYNYKILGTVTENLGQLGSPGMCCTFITRVSEGGPAGQLMGYVFDRIDEDGNLLVKDISENGWVDVEDLKVNGNGLPKSIIGFGQSVKWKNWSFDLFFRGVFGHSLINSNRAFYEAPSMITTYNVPKTATDMKNRQTGMLLKNYYGRLLDIHIEKASFLALDNISISFSFDFEKNNMRPLTIYLAGNNIFYLTRYKGADPNPRYVDEAVMLGDYKSVLVPGVDRRESWSRTRSFTFGLHLTLN